MDILENVGQFAVNENGTLKRFIDSNHIRAHQTKTGQCTFC